VSIRKYSFEKEDVSRLSIPVIRRRFTSTASACLPVPAPIANARKARFLRTGQASFKGLQKEKAFRNVP